MIHFVAIGTPSSSKPSAICLCAVSTRGGMSVSISTPEIWIATWSFWLVTRKSPNIFAVSTTSGLPVSSRVTLNWSRHARYATISRPESIDNAQTHHDGCHKKASAMSFGKGSKYTFTILDRPTIALGIVNASHLRPPCPNIAFRN